MNLKVRRPVSFSNPMAKFLSRRETPGGEMVDASILALILRALADESTRLDAGGSSDG